MKKLLSVSAIAFFASNAFAVTINFDDLAEGAIVSNQYAAQGVTFTAGHTAIAGLTAPTGTFASNTSMDVTLSTGSNVGGLGSPNLVSGNVLHGFSGWLNEDGDASFTLTFDSAITSISLDFAGISTPASSRLVAVSGGSIVSSISANAGGGQQTLSMNGINVTEVIVTVGDFNDWVGVDNLTFTNAIPEPASMLILGGAAIAAITRRRKR